METMLRLVAETSSPIYSPEKDELVLHMMTMYKVRCALPGLSGSAASGSSRERDRPGLGRGSRQLSFREDPFGH